MILFLFKRLTVEDGIFPFSHVPFISIKMPSVSRNTALSQ